MESAVILAGFVLVSIVIVYVAISSSTMRISQESRIVERQTQEDLSKLYEASRGMYRIGWSSYIKEVPLSNTYNIYITEDSITLEINGMNFSEAGPTPLVPKNLSSASSLNLTYVVYEGSGHINITKS